MIAVPIVIYAAIFFVTAREVFHRFRPHRVATCSDPQHRARDSHPARCFRRQRKDLTHLPFDRDMDAAAAAIGISLFWPLLFIYLLIIASPPETKREKNVREAREQESLERIHHA